jgi:two-component system sensor histidine kinase QseC
VKAIRPYLILALLSTICLANFVAAFHGYRSSMAAGDKLLDRQLIEMAQALEQLSTSPVTPPEHLYGDGRIFQIWKNEHLRYRSATAPETPLGTLEAGYHYTSHNGLRWRTYVLYNPELGLRIVAGQRYDLYARLIEHMVLESTLPIVWVVPVIGVLVWLIVGFGLHPLQRLAATLQQRRAGELSAVDRDGYPNELGVVITSINQLMERLAEAFEREQRFAADAAHELRTPLAAIKVSLHNLGNESKIDRHELDELTRSIDQMGHSIEQILALYRFTPEQLQAANVACDLRKLVQNAIIDMYAACQAKHQTIELEADVDISVDGGEFALQTLVRNLIDNASKYTPAGGTILLALTREHDASGDSACIGIDDSGPGIPAADYKRVFDRFYRVGGDRHASNVIGSGLGLSIVEHIVRLHGGRIALMRSPRLGGLRVEIHLPLAARAPVGVKA